MANAMTTIERAWVLRVKSVPCVVCSKLGLPQRTPTEAHHVREGAGISQRSSHFLTAALCREHHQGPNGLHGLGTRGFAARYKVDELDCVAATIEGVYRGLGE